MRVQHGTTVSLYVSQQKCELLDSLENQVRFSQLVAVVVASKGFGKSFLVEQLQKRLKDEVALAHVDASMAMSDDQLDKTISLQLGLSWQESEVDLATRVKNTHAEKVLITIDDAHLLSASCLEFILKLNQSQLTQKNASLFILLAGEASLPVMINKTSTFAKHPEMCVVFEIEPIQKSETHAIAQSFSHPNADLLSNADHSAKLEYFWQLAKGNPAELNYHMSRWLDDNSPTKVVEVNSDIPPKTILKAVVYSVLALLLSTMLVYQDEINQWISPATSDTFDDSERLADTLNATKEIEKGKEQLRQKEPADTKTIENEQNPSSKTKTFQPEEKDSDSKQGSVEQESSLTQQFEQALANEIKSSDAVTDSAKELDSKPTTKVITTGASSENEQKNTSESVDNVKKNTDSSKPVSETELPESSDNQQVNSAKAVSLTGDEKELLQQPNEHFVLQWAGVSSLKAAKAYREKHLAKDQMWIYRRSNKGKVLYLVVSDSFSNRALAEFALNNYLQQGVKEKPWIKSVSLVQKEIRQFELAD